MVTSQQKQGYCSFGGRLHLQEHSLGNSWQPTQQPHPQGLREAHMNINQSVLYSSIITHEAKVAPHDDVKHFPRNWPFVREIHRSPVNFPHKGQWRGALMFSLIYARINDWVNNSEAGDLKRQHGHYDVIVMHIKTQRAYQGKSEADTSVEYRSVAHHQGRNISASSRKKYQLASMPSTWALIQYKDVVLLGNPIVEIRRS